MKNTQCNKIIYNKAWNYRGNRDSYMLYIPSLKGKFKYFVPNFSCTFSTFLSFTKRLVSYLQKCNTEDNNTTLQTEIQVQEIDYTKVKETEMAHVVELYDDMTKENTYLFYLEPENYKSVRDRVYIQEKEII